MVAVGPAPAPAEPAPPSASEEPTPATVRVESIDDFVRQTTATVDKYLALFEQIQNGDSAEKAAAEMSNLSAQLRALTAALASIPYDSVRELEFVEQLAEAPLRIHTEHTKRVMNDPQLGPKVSVAAAHFLRVWKALLAEFLKRQRVAHPK